jgi:NAD(P)-dependent dehydrogenase (short-subunit alcohol dehydrogenase family)
MPTKTGGNKVALVTGSSRGIGKGVALALAGDHDIVVNYVSNEKAARETAGEIEALGRRALVVQADISSMVQRKRLVGEVLDEFGRIDVLVNNAGSGLKKEEMGDFEKGSLTKATWDRIMATLLEGPVFLTQEVVTKAMLPALRSGEATPLFHVVNITSSNAEFSSPTREPYCIAKAGLSMASQSSAVSLYPQGIHVSEIRPGVIDTELLGKRLGFYKRQIAKGGWTIADRVGTPEDVAKVVVFIAQGGLDHQPGIIVKIDGGMSVLHY